VSISADILMLSAFMISFLLILLHFLGVKREHLDRIVQLVLIHRSNTPALSG